MLTRIKSLFQTERTRPIFIIGTGRSGTHWLANTLRNHPEIDLTVEEQPIFGLSQRMAQNPELEDELFGPLVNEYRIRLSSSSRHFYLDKSHPNIWIAGKLKNAFPESLFLGVQRNPYATVASMLRHKGVLSWHQRWREFPLPNRFLGITKDNSGSYDSLPIASKCAMRWLAHQEKMRELQGTLEESLLIISYEDFQKNTDTTVGDLRDFLGLKRAICPPLVKKGSLDAWSRQLSSEQIQQIESIVGIAPEA